MSAILESPNTYDFGYAFNYEMWNENTVLTLINVPWNNDYRDIVRFATPSARDSWIDQQQKTAFTNSSLQKFSQNVRIDLPINKANTFNYLRASNPLMPVQGDVQRNYYYFITGSNFLAPDTTELTLQLDVWQTFGYDVSFGSCFVERGHIGIANENAFDNYGRDYLSEPEGFDIGSEYRTVHVESESVIGSGNYEVLVGSATDIVTSGGTADDPVLYSAQGGMIQGMPSGLTFYRFTTPSDFLTYMQSLTKRPWVSQGILSITAVPRMSRYYGADYTGKSASLEIVDDNGTSRTVYIAPEEKPDPRMTAMLTDWRNSDFISSVLGSRYSRLKKFLTYPYMVIELTTFSGSPLIIKPEFWQDANATIREMVALVPPGQRIVFSVNRYNADGETSNDAKYFADDDNAEFLDKSVAISNFPSFPVVNNMALSYLASNTNGLAWQEASAEWSQQRALRGAGVAYGQAEQGIGLENRLTRISTSTASQQANIQSGALFGHAAVGMAGAIGGGALAGAALGPEGAAAGAIGGAVQGAVGAAQAAVSVAALQAQTGASNAAANASNRARVGNAQYMADTNRGMATFAAKGDYANEIAGINAKIQDARMLQPSTSGQFGGDAFNMVNGNFGFSLRWKMVNKAAMKQVGDYWLRYGYAVQQFASIPSNLMCMSKFTYWKLSETYISQGPFPEGFKQILRGIFEKGVTVWAQPEYIGRTDWADNQPLNGISY